MGNVLSAMDSSRPIPCSFQSVVIDRASSNELTDTFSKLCSQCERKQSCPNDLINNIFCYIVIYIFVICECIIKNEINTFMYNVRLCCNFTVTYCKKVQ